MPTIELETWIPAPPERCFALSLSVDAHLATMQESGERAVAGVTSGQMGPGDTVTWKARHLGLPVAMTTRFSAYDAPHRFVDEQVRGPFRRWWHEHRFESADGGTRMIDVADFRAPAGPLGTAVERLGLTR